MYPGPHRERVSLIRLNLELAMLIGKPRIGESALASARYSLRTGGCLSSSKRFLIRPFLAPYPQLAHHWLFLKNGKIQKYPTLGGSTRNTNPAWGLETWLKYWRTAGKTSSLSVDPVFLRMTLCEPSA